MLEQLGQSTLSMSVAGVLVYLLTQVLPFDRTRPRFVVPRRAALWGLVAVFAGWALVAGLFLAIPRSEPSAASEPESSAPTANFNSVVSQAILVAIGFGPVVLFMRRQRQDWTSAGITRQNLRGAVIVGLVLGSLTTAGVLVFGNRSPGEITAGLESGHAWAFLSFAFVGFGEEFGFRGYLQTRLEAWLGWWRGWILASLVMALAHVVQRVTMMGLAPGDAFLDSLSLVPISLLMGWVMLRTRNVVAPGIAHTFANWAGTLL